MKFFPNIPGPERTKFLSLQSDALKYIEWYGREGAIKFLESRCTMCTVDDCECDYPEVLKIIKEDNV